MEKQYEVRTGGVSDLWVRVIPKWNLPQIETDHVLRCLRCTVRCCAGDCETCKSHSNFEW